MGKIGRKGNLNTYRYYEGQLPFLAVDILNCRLFIYTVSKSHVVIVTREASCGISLTFCMLLHLWPYVIPC